MRSANIDPRDVRWESAYPTYRVYFWEPSRVISDEWRLDDVSDVREVLTWAADRVGPDRTFSIYIEATGPEGNLGLIRLAGIDPYALNPSGLAVGGSAASVR
jgi:hypothetical protein